MLLLAVAVVSFAGSLGLAGLSYHLAAPGGFLGGRLSASLPLSPPTGPTARPAGTAVASVLGLSTPEVSSVTISPSPASVDHGQTMTLTATASGASGTVSYQWYASGSCPTTSLITGATSATYTTPALTATTSYCVTASDSTGVVATSAADQVTVNPALGTPSISPTSPSIDLGQSVTFTSAWSGGTPVYSARIYSSATASCSASSTFLVTVTTSGSATSATFPAVSPTQNTSYCVVLSDSAVGSPAQSTISTPPDPVTVHGDPSVTTPVPSPHPSADVGQPVTFTSTASGGSGSDSYVWSGLPTGCAFSSTLALSCSDPTTPGNYTVAVTVTDSDHFNATSGSLSFRVYADPTITVPTFSKGALDVGQSLTGAVSASQGSGGFTYRWSGLPNGCTPPSAASFTCSPTGEGSSTVTVTVTDSDGFSVTSGSASFTVNPPITLTVTSSTTSPKTGETVTFSASHSGGTPHESVTFSFGDATMATGTNVTHSYGSAGTYTVTVWVNDSAGASTSKTIVLTVTAPASTFLGQPYWVWAVIGAAIVAAAAAGGYLATRGRKPHAPTVSGGSAGDWKKGELVIGSDGNSHMQCTNPGDNCLTAAFSPASRITAWHTEEIAKTTSKINQILKDLKAQGSPVRPLDHQLRFVMTPAGPFLVWAECRAPAGESPQPGVSAGDSPNEFYRKLGVSQADPKPTRDWTFIYPDTYECFNNGTTQTVAAVATGATSAFHDAALEEGSKRINQLLEECKKVDPDPERPLSFVKTPDGLFIVRNRTVEGRPRPKGAITAHSDPAEIRKALGL